MAMALDYYDILGVPPKADAGDIKKAYRLLALKWHPDRNPGDPWAADQFLRLGEAYHVLTDPARRAAYDWLRSLGMPSGEVPFQIRPQSSQGVGVSFQGSASHRLRRPTSRAKSRSRRRKGCSAPARFPPKGVHHNSGGLSHWLLSLKDLQHRLVNWLIGTSLKDLEWEMVPTPNQPDLIMDLRLPRRLAAQGVKVHFLLRSKNTRRRLNLAIPPGVKDGSCIKVKGGGKNSDQRRGHLYINIRLRD